MRRQVNNLLFLFSFMIALQLGNLNYLDYCSNLFDKTTSKDLNVCVAEQHNYKVLPSEIYLNAHRSFIEGVYINKNYMRQKVEDVFSKEYNKTTSTTNYGRDGPP